MAGRHRHDEVGRERVFERLRNAGAELGSRLLRPLRVHVEDRDGPAASEKRPRRRLAVDAGADDRGGSCIRAAERLGGEHGSRARAQRGHRRGVEAGDEPPVLRARQENEPGDGRQPLGRIARERRHPLERGVAAAERRHRAEVARRVGGDVDLGRHRPLAPRVRDERLAHGLDGPLRRHRRLDVPPAEDRNAQSALTAETSASTDAFASPNSIDVFGSTNSGLSTPAKPGLIERLSTMTFFA